MCQDVSLNYDYLYCIGNHNFCINILWLMGEDPDTGFELSEILWALAFRRMIINYAAYDVCFKQGF